MTRFEISWTRACAEAASRFFPRAGFLRQRFSLRVGGKCAANLLRKNGMRYFYWWFVLWIILAALAFTRPAGEAVKAQSEPPGPQMPPLPQGLDPPPTVYPPTQVSQGSYVYYMVCMACHGDKGQGLSDDWRGALDPADQNCWQSRCHASNFPPGGFVFPKIVPAVASPGMLARFDTALELYQFIKQSMPFQAPGSLSDEEYWQLTAFLVSLNGIDPGASILGPEQAAFLKLHPPVQAARPDSATLPIVLSGAGLAVVLFLWIVGQKNRRRSEDR